MSQKQEIFPVSSFVHMEETIGKMRRLIMRSAAGIAKSKSEPEEVSFTVTTKTVDDAFRAFFREVASHPSILEELSKL